MFLLLPYLMHCIQYAHAVKLCMHIHIHVCHVCSYISVCAHTLTTTPPGHVHCVPLYSVFSNPWVPSELSCKHHPAVPHMAWQFCGPRQSAGDTLETRAVYAQGLSWHLPACARVWCVCVCKCRYLHTDIKWSILAQLLHVCCRRAWIWVTVAYFLD